MLLQAQTGVGAKTRVSAAAPPCSRRRAGQRHDPRADIVKKIGGIKLEDVRITPVNGIYEITRGSEISYVSSDGRYAILGDLIDSTPTTIFRERAAAAFARA